MQDDHAGFFLLTLRGCELPGRALQSGESLYEGAFSCAGKNQGGMRK